jgi:hypothetical protein
MTTPSSNSFLIGLPGNVTIASDSPESDGGTITAATLTISSEGTSPVTGAPNILLGGSLDSTLQLTGYPAPAVLHATFSSKL